MDPQSPEAQAKAIHMFAAMLPLIAIFVLVGVTLYIIPLWQICKKAGLGGALSLVALIPGIGKLIVLYIVAFSQWKVVPLSSTVAYPPSYPPPPTYPPPPAYPPVG